MTVYYIKGYSNVSDIYEITDTAVGPFTAYDGVSLKQYMQKVDEIEVEYFIINELP